MIMVIVWGRKKKKENPPNIAKDTQKDRIHEDDRIYKGGKNKEWKQMEKGKKKLQGSLWDFVWKYKGL